MRVPPLETARLLIRPFVADDLDAAHQLLDIDLAEADFGTAGATARDEREGWLRWTIMGYDEFARLYQPPYGERAIVLKTTGELIGAVGYVPCLNAFGQLAAAPGDRDDPATGFFSTEFGLFYAVSPAHQRRGYAAEAARTMIAHAFAELRLRRIVATTTYDNHASLGVMRRLGMTIARNPYPDPPWLQVVGTLDNSPLPRTPRA